MHAPERERQRDRRRSLQPCSGCSISPNVIPASPSAQSRAPTTSTRASGSRSRPTGTTRRIRTSVTTTIGTLIAKIQRHEAASTSWPPTTGTEHGPDPAPRGPRADRLAALVRREGRDDHGQRRRRQQRPGDPLERPRGDEHLDGRAPARTCSEVTPKADTPEREDAPLAEDVAQRAADQQQRGERDQVGVGGPLLPRQAAAEVLGDRRQRHVGHRRVDRDDGRAEDGGDQHQPLGALR